MSIVETYQSSVSATQPTYNYNTFIETLLAM